MSGTIQRRHVLRHPLTVISGFGWRVFFRALFDWRAHTFLELLT